MYIYYYSNYLFIYIALKHDEKIFFILAHAIGYPDMEAICNIRILITDPT